MLQLLAASAADTTCEAGTNDVSNAANQCQVSPSSGSSNISPAIRPIQAAVTAVRNSCVTLLALPISLHAGGNKEKAHGALTSFGCGFGYALVDGAVRTRGGYC